MASFSCMAMSELKLSFQRQPFVLASACDIYMYLHLNLFF